LVYIARSARDYTSTFSRRDKSVLANTIKNTASKARALGAETAFHVIDLDPEKMRAVYDTVSTRDAPAEAAGRQSGRAAVREDARKR
jgi:hypothetical protein